MTSPIRNRPATRKSAVAGSSKGNDSTSELQGARPIPVPSVLTTRQNASSSLPISDNAPDLRNAQVRIAGHLAPHYSSRSTWGQALLRHRVPLPQQMQRDFNYLVHRLLQRHQEAPLSPKIQMEISRLQQLLLPLQQNHPVDINSLLQQLTSLRMLLLPVRVPHVHECISELLHQLRLLQLLPNRQDGQARLPKHMNRLLRLHQYDQEWTLRHFPALDEMSPSGLKQLLPLLQYDKAWTTENLDSLVKLSAVQLKYILPLAEFDKEWTAAHLPTLNWMDEIKLHRLLPLLRHNKEWTNDHLLDLDEIHGFDCEELLLLLQHDMEWTTKHLHLLKKLSEYEWPYVLPLLQHNREWVTDHLHELGTMKKNELRTLFLKFMDDASEKFISAANPYVKEELSLNGKNIREVTQVLQSHGASRSIINPGSMIDSYLTEKFKNNFEKIPTATFGVENEMFIPGLPRRLPSESDSEGDSDDKEAVALKKKIENELNDRLGIKNKKYHYVKDNSLRGAPLATTPIEQTTSILKSPEDIQHLQSALSILNDWGAFTNRTAGVHIHTGIKQWKAVDCLNTPEEKSKNPFLHQWDQELEQRLANHPLMEIKMTPYQLLFMKQFLVNMTSMQKDFYLVSRSSKYSQPNCQENDLDKFFSDISIARNYNELVLRAQNMDDEDEDGDDNVGTRGIDRYFNVNLKAYSEHGTIEVRGFTKKNSNTMEIDPNLPVRDIIFMQDALIKTLHSTKDILLSGASPSNPIQIRPSAGLDEITKDYVQDVFLLEMIHALGQRIPAKRVNTMEAILKDKDLIASDTLQKIREGQKSLLEADSLAQHFLAVLSGDEQWNPSSIINKSPLKRTNSLRSMADASFEAIYQSNKSRRLV